MPERAKTPFWPSPLRTQSAQEAELELDRFRRKAQPAFRGHPLNARNPIVADESLPFCGFSLPRQSELRVLRRLQGLANRVSDFLEGAKRKEPKPAGRALANTGTKQHACKGKGKRTCNVNRSQCRASQLFVFADRNGSQLWARVLTKFCRAVRLDQLTDKLTGNIREQGSETGPLHQHGMRMELRLHFGVGSLRIQKQTGY